MVTSIVAVFGMYSFISHHFVGLEFSFYLFLDATGFLCSVMLTEKSCSISTKMLVNILANVHRMWIIRLLLSKGIGPWIMRFCGYQ